VIVRGCGQCFEFNFGTLTLLLEHRDDVFSAAASALALTANSRLYRLQNSYINLSGYHL